MKKKYIIGGIVVCVGIAAWIGVYALENRTEKAVAGALASVPAQAQEIRYSLLNNTLLLKGVTYDVSEENVKRKGSVEQVEIKGFNPACLSVSAAAYDPDALPVVAQSMTATGISDDIGFGDLQIAQKIDEISVSGWHQRLGVLLERFQKHRDEASFYEEMYRYRLDGMAFRGMRSLISMPDMPSPISLDMEEMGLAESARAPRGDEKVAPFSVYLSGMRFGAKGSTGRVSGELQRLDIKDVLLPDPFVMAELVRINKKMDATDLDSETGMDDFDEQIIAMSSLLQKNYENKLLFSRFGMQGFRFMVDEANPQAGEPFVAVRMKSLDYRMGLSSGQYTYAATLDALQLNMAELRSNEVVRKYAPDGFTLNANSESVVGDAKITGRGRYDLVGLGALEGDMTLTGNIRDLRRLASMADLTIDPSDLLQSIQLQKMNLKYHDSGLTAMAIELIAKEDGQSPESLLEAIFQSLREMSQIPAKNAQQLGAALTELFTLPGEFGMSYEPVTPVSLMELVSMIMIDPGSVPVTFSSKQGTKPLTDYLAKP
ncbi:hypothetical protein [Mailhella sp.]|uniref:hypothetical protein n=1 Tax=Mailhella sp. TaxID=1981029 RepID=UPI003AB85B67